MSQLVTSITNDRTWVKCAILALAEREKICDVGGVGGDGLVSYQNIRAFDIEVYPTRLIDMIDMMSLMAFVNCRQLTQHQVY